MPTKSPNRNVYDDEGHDQPLDGGALEAGSSGNDPAAEEIRRLNNNFYGPDAGKQGYNQNNPASKAGPGSDLKKQEKGAGSGSSSALDSKEKSFADRLHAAETEARKAGGLFRHEGAGGKLASLKGRLGKMGRKKIAIWVTTAAVGGGGIFGFSFLQGPLQFIHFAQLLQKFHLRSNEDFGNDRTSKVMLYAMAGKGAERGRLTTFNNSRADKWETRMVRDTGMRPLYSNTSGRLVAYEIVNRDRAFQTLANISDKGGKSAAAVERALGQDAEIKPISELDPKKQDLRRTAKNGGSKPPGSVLALSLQDSDYKTRRLVSKAMISSINVNNIAAVNGVRLLKKRSGINFHVFEGVGYRQWLDKRADNRENREAYREEQRKKRRAYIKGAKAGIVATAAGKSHEDVQKGVEEAKTAAETEGGEASKKVTQNLAKGMGALVVVSIFCSVNDVGDNVAQFKYEEGAVQMMKMGMLVVSEGNGVMAGKASMDELSTLNANFYDKETDTSWTQANTIRAEQGKEPISGEKYELPKEAQLKNINDKPFLFDVIGGVPLLAPACSAIDAVIKGIPGAEFLAKQASNAVIFAVDQFLSLASTSVEELTQKGISALAGETVNVDAKGAEFGNLVNTGAHLAANDQALTMGGRALEPTEVAELREYENLIDNQNKSFAQRYLDIYDSSSLLGSAIVNTPSFSQAASSIGSVNPFRSFVNHAASIISPKTHALAVDSKSVYGVAKYGYSYSEQNDVEFEDPGKNAAIVEPKLDALNKKYGPCFGMRVTATEERISVETKAEGDEEVNVFKVQENDNCKHKNFSPAEQKEFTQYRFYIADAVTSVALACDDGDEVSCGELGVGTGTAGGSGDASGDTGAVSGDAKELAQQILDNPNIDISASNFCRYCEEDIKNTAEGKPAYGNVNIDVKLLAFLLEVGKAAKVDVNSITGAGSGHSTNSNHYKGAGIDFGCNGISGSVLDRIGEKHDIKSNFERCDAGIHHWHYSVGGR